MEYHTLKTNAITYYLLFITELYGTSLQDSLKNQ